jgi:polyketide synthase 12
VLRRQAQRTPDARAYTFLRDGESDELTLTFGEVDRLARSIASELRRCGVQEGERALLLYPPGIDFIPGFFGCLYAGVVAVPTFPPDPTRLDRTLPRLQAIVADCGPKVALTTRELLDLSAPIFQHAPELDGVGAIATDEISPSDAWDAVGVAEDGVAFLQYTSGSTGTPKGVIVTHRNLIHNSELIHRAAETDERFRAVGWLPLYHDMGLVGTVLQPCYVGARSVLMSPMHFLQKPFRWLDAISRFRATHSPAPNFAYDLCVRKVTPEQRARLDLSTWKVALNAAEPLRADTLERFIEAFAPRGFRREAFFPCYGLAEGTLIVSAALSREAPVVLPVVQKALECGRAEPVPEENADRQALVSVGRVLGDQEVLIADPETGTRKPDGVVGEIWLAGGSVAAGYWGSPDESEQVFGARLADGGGPYLRTSDLGFLREGELFVTGRAKDLIIVRGMNYYPQDIEATVEHAHPALRPGCGVAFSVPGEEGERLVVVQEVDTRRAVDPAEIGAQVHRAIADVHGLSAHEIVLIEPRTILKTSNGKLQRSATCEAYLAGELAVLECCAGGTAAALVGAASPLLAQGRSRSEIERRIAQILAEELELDPSSVHRDLPFVDLGLDSAKAVILAGVLEQWLGHSLPSTLVWDHPTVGALAAHLAGRPAAAEEEMGTDAWTEPFAIVGLACRFPGAPDREAFWKLLRGSGDAIQEVPPERWDADAWYDPDPSMPMKMTTRWGGFLEEVDRFDADFFGISPREASQMDPQQRILLQTTWDALENAGITRQAASGSAAGVFVGISGTEYQRIGIAEDREVLAFGLPGNAHSIAANRLSYLLGLRGPSFTIDTACSSSLIALHLACQSMRDGECEFAIVAGINVILDPTITVAFSQGGFMAEDGRCKSFDARADGYVRAEGCGVAALKPLSSALADGDRIYAVVRGTAVNNDGPRNGLTAPSATGQEAVLRSAYRRADADPASVAYVEAHGTGTQLGDPIEARALGTVLGLARPSDRPLLVGSVKSNIGHCEPASGMAGLIKTALAIQTGEIPASLHFETPNPHIAFDELGLRVVRELTPWPEGPRLAGVSSFGFGGTNAHVVLEAPAPDSEPDPEAARGPMLLPLSARSPEALRALAASWEEWLGTEEAPLRDAVFTASLRRTHHEERLSVVGENREELRSQLAALAAGDAPGAGASQGRAHERRLAFVFSGQGSQWPGMGRELLETEPVFRAAFAEVEALFAAQGLGGLREQVLAEGSASRLANTEVAQPAIFAVQVALTALWRSLGIEPGAVVGHSVGEVAGAHAAGALSLEEAARLVLLRGQLMQPARGLGRMLAVALPEAKARDVLAGREDAVSLAAVNGPRSIVLSGDPATLEAIQAELAERRVGCRPVRVEYAFHSAQMEPFRAELVERLAGLAPRPAALPFYSTVTGTERAGTELDAAYWGRNLREPVRFAAAVESLCDAGFDTFLEVGGHPVLALAIQETLEARRPAETDAGAPALVVGSLRREHPEQRAILAALGSLWTGGARVDWRRLHPEGGRCVSLPAYPWQGERHWFARSSVESSRNDRRRVRRAVGSDAPCHPLLETYLPLSRHAGAHYWETQLSLEGHRALTDHRVGEAAVLPAAACCDLALAAAAEAFGAGTHVLEQLAFERALGVPESGARTLQVVATREGADRAAVQFLSRAADAAPDAPWTLHAEGRLQLAASDEAVAACDPENLDALRARCSEAVEVEPFYAALAEQGLRYGPAFRSVAELWRGPGEAIGRIRLPVAAGTADRHRLHPSLLDGAFQVVAAAVVGEVASGTFVPVALRRLTLTGEPARELWSHARVHEASESELEADVVLLDHAGSIVAEAAGLRLARLESGPAEGDWFHHVVWQPREHQADETNADEAPGTWLVLEDASGVADALCAALAARGSRCVTVRTGPDFQRLGANRYQVDPCRPEDLQELLKHALGNGHGGCLGVLHLWGLDAPPPDDGAPLEAASDLCVGVLHLVQAIARAGFRDAPRLWIVTRGAQPLAGDPEPVFPTPAALWGLARVVSHEQPELCCTRVDLDPRAPEGELDSLVEELAAPHAEDEIAWRGGTRHVARLVQGLPPVEAGEEPRDPARGRPFRLEIDAPGVLDRLTLRAAAPRPPGPGEITLRVRAAGLNFKDVLLALGAVPSPMEGQVPLGGECAGTVEAIGEGVDGLSPGDEVVALGGCCLASHVTTRAALVARKPARLSFEEAATLPIVFLTAHHALHALGRMRAGERVLVHSATGGVGLAAVQLAERAGAEVFATAGNPEKRALLRERGVRHVMDSRSLDFASEVLEATGGRGVDLVLNSLSGEAIEKNFEALAPYGRFLEIGIRDIYENHKLGLWPFHKSLSYFAIDLSRMLLERSEELGAALRELMEAFEHGDLEPLPVQIQAIDEAAAAFRTMAQARHIGKIALRVGSEDVLVAAERSGALRDDASYLITGGLGGLGLAVAEWMVEQGARHLLLLGRGSPAPPVRETIARLRDAGAFVEVARADVSEPAARAALRDALARIGQPLRGVIHAAGVLDDGILLRQSAERFRGVMAPKVQGAWNLDRWTREDPLDFFVLFSSVASVLGSPGQGNYCAANAFLDALAHARRREGRPALSINWGPWSEVGMAADTSLRGMTSVSPELGTRVLGRLLREGPAQVAVMSLDLRQWAQLFPQASELPLLEELARETSAEARAAGPSPVREELLGIASGAERLTHLLGYVREQVAAVLGLEVSKVESRQPLTDMGFDSLMALELRNRCEAGIGVRLSPTLIWAHPTLGELVPELARRMGVDLGDGPTPEMGEDAPDVVDDLSTEELAEALAEQLEHLEGDGAS